MKANRANRSCWILRVHRVMNLYKTQRSVGFPVTVTDRAEEPVDSHQCGLPAHAEGSCDCSTASVCRCPRRLGWILEEADQHMKPGAARLHALQSRCLTVQMQQHVGLEQVLGPSYLALRHTGTKRNPDRKQRHTSVKHVQSADLTFFKTLTTKLI